MTIDFRTSLLFVENVAVSRRFYEGMLHQAVTEDFGECLVFGAFAVMQRDAASRVVFGKTFLVEKPRDHEHRFELYFETADIDGACAGLQRTGVPFVHGIQEQPWGQRVFRVYDPDGYVVELGEPMRAFILRFHQSGLTPEQVSKRCRTPLGVVRAILEEDTSPAI